MQLVGAQKDFNILAINYRFVQLNVRRVSSVCCTNITPLPPLLRPRARAADDAEALGHREKRPDSSAKTKLYMYVQTVSRNKMVFAKPQLYRSWARVMPALYMCIHSLGALVSLVSCTKQLRLCLQLLSRLHERARAQHYMEGLVMRRTWGSRSVGTLSS